MTNLVTLPLIKTEVIPFGGGFSGSGFGFDFGDIFEGFFGGGRRASRQTGPARGTTY